MKLLLKNIKTILLLFITVTAYSQDYHVRFGFIGNSITIGTNLPNPTVDCYPSQIGVLLKEKYGDTCVIQNYAVSGRTMLKHGDNPIWKEASFQTGWNYAPDICFICLGTNDSKPYNWDVCGNEFYDDYKSMIDTFLLRNPRTKFIVCRPDPAFGVVFDIRNPIIIDNIIPLVDSIAKTTGAVLVDFYTPMLDSAALFKDKIHPDQRGAKAMAKIAFETIVKSDIIHKVKKGYTLVTSIKSNIVGELRIKDSATISWTTINATEVFLNGKNVSINGSIKVAPNVNTKYILKAVGSLNSDSLMFEQKVYKPALTKVYTYFTPTEVYQGDTVLAYLVYFDQKNKKMLDTIFDINWSIAEGYGRFINKGDNKIYYIADSTGYTKFSVVINDVKYNGSVTVIEKIPNVIPNKLIDNLEVFPNPAKNIINIKLSKPTSISITLADITGRIVYSKEIKRSSNYTIDVSQLKRGFFILTIKSKTEEVSKKIELQH